jgi:outer membrane protein OmpA-like peptidoglycan-associated protein
MRYLILAFLICPLISFSQSLLVNGSFEEENICSEYKVNCAPEGWMYTVPSYSYYYKSSGEAYKGAYFVAFIAGHSLKSYYRTFVRSRLLCRLQGGRTYRLQFAVKSPHPILDSIGVYFSSTDFLFDKRLPQTIVPSVYLSNAVEKPAVGNTGWQHITIDYTASGNEAYITFGNFRRRDLLGATGVDKERNFLVMLDEVSLVALDPKERLCSDWQQTKDAIYSQDERHEYQARQMIKNLGNPPKERPSSPTFTLQIDTLIVPDVLFATDSYIIRQKTTSLLDSFSKRINSLAIDSITINGHTDYRGTAEHNRELSYMRALSVMSYLQRSVRWKMIPRGFGSEQPVADNRTAAGRQQNRRVEILIYKKQ